MAQAKKTTPYSKETEIEMLLRLKHFLINYPEDAYLSDMFTPEAIDQMVFNIQSDYPIMNNSPFILSSNVVVMEQTINGLKRDKDQMIERMRMRNAERAMSILKAGPTMIDPQFREELIIDLVGERDAVMMFIETNTPLTDIMKTWLRDKLI